jgi:hypothetical protein
MRYLEIVLAGLIFLTSFVVGNSLPQIELFGSAPAEDFEATLPGPAMLASPTINPSMLSRPADAISTAQAVPRPFPFEPETIALTLSDVNSTLPNGR